MNTDIRNTSLLLVAWLCANSVGLAQTPAATASFDPHDLGGVYMTTAGPGAGMSGAAPGGAPGGPASGVGLAMAPQAQPGAALPAGLPPSGDSPRMRCIPQYQVGFAPYAGQIIHTPGRITIITEFNHMVRRVYLDEAFPKTIEPSYMGYSVGRWEGNTLVVETRGLKAGGNAFGNISANTRVIERFTRSADGAVLQEASYETPDAQGKITTQQQSAINTSRPDLHLMEFICEDGAGDFYSGGDAS